MPEILKDSWKKDTYGATPVSMGMGATARKIRPADDGVHGVKCVPRKTGWEEVGL